MRRAILLCAIALCISAGGSAQSSSPSQKRGTHPMAKPAANPAAALQAARASFAKLPLSFEENQGQTDPRVKYVSRGSGYNLFLTNDEAVLALHSASPNRGSAKETRDGAALWLKMLGGMHPPKFSVPIHFPEKSIITPATIQANGIRAFVSTER